MSIIRTDNLNFTYEDGTKALKGVNLSIEKGEKIAFLGANGSGKSTFFLCLNGILKPKSGKIYYEEEPVEYNRKGLIHLRSKVGIVFQDPDNQLFSASVYKEISFGLLNLGVSREEAERKVEAIMEEMEITAFHDKPTHLLSGGQKKQVSIADILVMEPEVIILDEPASALDPKHTLLVNDLLDKMSKKGITLLLSTHDVNHALEWAEKIVIFKDGKITAFGKPEEIFLDEELLKDSNLIQPQVIKMYSSLCKKGFLDKDQPVPKNFETLEKYILQNSLMNRTDRS